MTTAQDIEHFLKKLKNSWQPNPDKSDPMFHDGGGVDYPGQTRIYPDIELSMTDQFHMVAPDTQMRLLHWAQRDDTLFTEWELTCTLNGRPFKVTGANRFRMKGDKALDATAYVDRLNILQFFDPAIARLDFREKMQELLSR